jgi:hypothetical protein
MDQQNGGVADQWGVRMPSNPPTNHPPTHSEKLKPVQRRGKAQPKPHLEPATPRVHAHGWTPPRMHAPLNAIHIIP